MAIEETTFAAWVATRRRSVELHGDLADEGPVVPYVRAPSRMEDLNDT